VRARNPDSETYCSLTEAGRTLHLSYQQVHRLFLKGSLKGIDLEGSLWLLRESVANYALGERNA
jgi:hypothetical protein